MASASTEAPSFYEFQKGYPPEADYRWLLERYKSLYPEAAARQEAEAADREVYEFAQRFADAFQERVKDPTNTSSKPMFGLFSSKPTNINAAIRTLGYSPEQITLINTIIALKGEGFKTNPDKIGTITGIIREGRRLFPVGGRFQRIARFFATGKNKKGEDIFPYTRPEWYTTALSQAPTPTPQSGGRRTRRRRSSSRRARKSRRHSRR